MACTRVGDVTVAMSASRIEPKSVFQGKSRTSIKDNME